MIDLSYGIIMWAEVSFVLSQCTRFTHGQTDGRTDGRTDFDSKTVRMHSQSHGKMQLYVSIVLFVLEHLFFKITTQIQILF